MIKGLISSSGASGAVNYKGTWNASTNTPTLASGVGTSGDYYIVSVAGTTNLDGTNLWAVGDWAVFNGSTWNRLPGGENGTFETVTATTVNAGNIRTTSNTISAQNTNGDITLTSNGSGNVIANSTTIPKSKTLVSSDQVGTIASQNANSVAITGGAIDGTNIGATTRGTGAFTTATFSNGTATATLDYSGTTVRFGSAADLILRTTSTDRVRISGSAIYPVSTLTLGQTTTNWVSIHGNTLSIASSDTTSTAAVTTTTTTSVGTINAGATSIIQLVSSSTFYGSMFFTIQGTQTTDGGQFFIEGYAIFANNAGTIVNWGAETTKNKISVGTNNYVDWAASGSTWGITFTTSGNALRAELTNNTASTFTKVSLHITRNSKQS